MWGYIYSHTNYKGLSYTLTGYIVILLFLAVHLKGNASSGSFWRNSHWHPYIYSTQFAQKFSVNVVNHCGTHIDTLYYFGFYLNCPVPEWLILLDPYSIMQEEIIQSKANWKQGFPKTDWTWLAAVMTGLADLTLRSYFAPTKLVHLLTCSGLIQLIWILVKL